VVWKVCVLFAFCLRFVFGLLSHLFSKLKHQKSFTATTQPIVFMFNLQKLCNRICLANVSWMCDNCFIILFRTSNNRTVNKCKKKEKSMNRLTSRTSSSVYLWLDRDLLILHIIKCFLRLYEILQLLLFRFDTSSSSVINVNRQKEMWSHSLAL
jgi:hypothetical protein